MLDDLLQRFRRHDRLALSRLVSLVARGEQVDAILRSVAAHPPSLSSQGTGLGGGGTKPARVVAITGGGGVGKSTLAGKLIEQIRADDLKVAVLACDPQSPLSGGALLGDRFRMPARPDDDGVFIRSLAAAGGQGALAQHLDALIRLLEAFGFEVILIETVGAGQGDTAVRDLADVLVLLLQPETGDDLQWEKAGLFEVADIIAIHKADLPGAERVEAQVLAALGLAMGPPVPVLRVSARLGVGVAELWKAVAAIPLRRTVRQEERDLLRLAQETLAARFAAAQSRDEEPLRDLLQQWRRGELDATQAATAVLKLLGKMA
jgi:LAO/AO transport system ATPase